MSPWNILLLDARNKALGEYSSTTAMSLAGAIFYSKVVEDCQRVSENTEDIFKCNRVLEELTGLKDMNR